MNQSVGQSKLIFFLFFSLSSYIITDNSLIFSEYLEEESKKKEEKISKIKLVAVKAKKELDSSRKEVRLL